MAKKIRVRTPEQTNKPEPAPEIRELTPPQLVGVRYGSSTTPGQSELVSSNPATYKDYREIRKDPTVALARSCMGMAVLAGAWSVEADDDAPEGAEDLVYDLVEMREAIMEPAVYAGIDYGWWGAEKVFAVEDGLVRLHKLKSLLPDLTTILIDEMTGAYRGYQQTHATTGALIKLDTTKCLHIGYRVEGTQWYGYPLLENVRLVQKKWDTADKGAEAYDKKVAGSHWVVYYPRGTSNVDGVDTDNGQVAQDLLAALEACGSITVPRNISDLVEQLNNQAALEATSWGIELIEDSGGRQPTFVDRLKYLDALKVRAMLLPERSILEGEFGTKAEAGEHADVAIKAMQLIDRHITRHVNWHVVDQLLRINYGIEAQGTVRLKATPLVDEQVAYLREVYTKLLENPQAFLEEVGTINTEALKEKLGIPSQEAPEVPPLAEPAEGLDADQRSRMSGFIPSLNSKKPVNGDQTGEQSEEQDDTK